MLANPSPIKHHIRADFEHSPSESQKPPQRRLEEAEQYVHYLKAQRIYTTLLERYNPGLNMPEEDRVRLTAKRVGMDLPVEALPQGQGQGNKE